MPYPEGVGVGGIWADEGQLHRPSADQGSFRGTLSATHRATDGPAFDQAHGCAPKRETARKRPRAGMPGPAF